MLSTVFTNIPRSVLWNVLLKNHFQVELSIEYLLEVSKQNENTTQSIPNSSITNQNGVKIFQKANEGQSIMSNDFYRGKKVSLPNNFLRVPGWEKRHEEAIRKKDFMSLFADPVFLREVEREFGDDYELVLRDHLKAEHQNWVEADLERQRVSPSLEQSAVNAAAYSGSLSYGSGAHCKGEANSPNSPYSLEDSLNDVNRRMQDIIEKFGQTLGMYSEDTKTESETIPLFKKTQDLRISEEDDEDMPLLWRTP